MRCAFPVRGNCSRPRVGNRSARDPHSCERPFAGQAAPGWNHAAGGAYTAGPSDVERRLRGGGPHALRHRGVCGLLGRAGARRSARQRLGVPFGNSAAFGESFGGRCLAHLCRPGRDGPPSPADRYSPGACSGHRGGVGGVSCGPGQRAGTVAQRQWHERAAAHAAGSVPFAFRTRQLGQTSRRSRTAAGLRACAAECAHRAGCGR